MRGEVAKTCPPHFSICHADACAHETERKREETDLATWLPGDGHPDHKALWPAYGPTILNNCFLGNEINEETLGKSEGNLCRPAVKQKAL